MRPPGGYNCRTQNLSDSSSGVTFNKFNYRYDQMIEMNYFGMTKREHYDVYI